MAVGYTIGFLVFFFGTLFAGESFGAAWMPILGWAIVAMIVTVVAFLIVKKNKELKVEYAPAGASSKTKDASKM